MEENKELQELKDEAETLNMKLAELDEEELEQIAGGFTKITNNEYINKLNQRICYKCNGELIFEKRWTAGNSYECKKCKKKYALLRDICGHKNRSYWNDV